MKTQRSRLTALFRFHDMDNEQLICYSKKAEDDSNLLIIIVNLDPHHTHSGILTLPLEELGIPETNPTRFTIY